MKTCEDIFKRNSYTANCVDIAKRSLIKALEPIGQQPKATWEGVLNDNSTHFPRVVDETKCANHLARFLQGEGVAGMTSLLKILFFIQDLPNISRRC